MAIPSGKLVAYALANDRDAAWLNRVWREKPKMKPSDAIPIIDIGWDTLNYDLLGDGIRLAQTGPQRFMLAGQVPAWMNAGYEEPFTDIIDRIRPLLQHPTASNIESAIMVLDGAAFVTGFKHEYVVMGKHTKPVDLNALLSAPAYAAM